MELIKKLEEQRAALQAEIDKVLEAPTAEGRKLTDDEGKLFDEKETEIKALVARIAQLKDNEARRAAAAVVIATNGPVVRVRTEPLTYQRGNGQSYFRDMSMALVARDAEAAARLTRHGAEMDVELVERHRRREHQAETEMRGIGEGSAFEKRVNPNRTDGQGGYFVQYMGRLAA